MQQPIVVNKANITGVMHHTHSQQFYELRRYVPTDELAYLVEQFWIVDWALPTGERHVQRNLPDPNFHLVLDNNTLSLLGPVSKSYQYTMRGVGRVIGVKFALAASLPAHDIVPSQFVDTRILAQEKFTFAAQLTNQLMRADDDNRIIKALREALKPFCIAPKQPQLKVQQLVAMIKNNPELTQVEQLSQSANMPMRTIQRYFKEQLGLSPKWLIRKYRMHQALALLESSDKSLAEVAIWLGYSDQAHFIKDFKHFTGATPARFSHKR